MLFLLFFSVASAKEFSINFVKTGVTHGFNAEGILTKILKENNYKYSVSSKQAFRSGTSYYWGKQILQKCNMRKIESYNVYETPDSFIVEVSLKKVVLSKLKRQGQWPIIRQEKIDLLKCDETYALDFSPFGFAEGRKWSSSLLLEYSTKNQKAYILPKEIGGLERFYSWSEDRAGDLSVVIGAPANKDDEKLMKAKKTFLILQNFSFKHFIP